MSTGDEWLFLIMVFEWCSLLQCFHAAKRKFTKHWWSKALQAIAHHPEKALLIAKLYLWSYQMSTWFISWIARPIIKPLSKVLQSLTQSTNKVRKNPQNMSFWFIFLRTQKRQRTNFSGWARERKWSFQVHLLHLSLYFSCFIGIMKTFGHIEKGNRRIST